jgi:hypothetical protein
VGQARAGELDKPNLQFSMQNTISVHLTDILSSVVDPDLDWIWIQCGPWNRVWIQQGKKWSRKTGTVHKFHLVLFFWMPRDK